MKIVLTLLVVTFGICQSHAAASSPKHCDVLLADLILNTPKTIAVEELNRFIEMNRRVFHKHVLEHRPMSSTTRTRREPGQEEYIFHLNIRGMSSGLLYTRTNLVIRFFEERIRYDSSTGTVDDGRIGATIMRPLDVRFRFDLQEGYPISIYRLLHDNVIPLIKAELDALNEKATEKFRRRLLAGLEQVYPGEYETQLAPELTPNELGFLISELGAK